MFIYWFQETGREPLIYGDWPLVFTRKFPAFGISEAFPSVSQNGTSWLQRTTAWKDSSPFSTKSWQFGLGLARSNSVSSSSHRSPALYSAQKPHQTVQELFHLLRFEFPQLLLSSLLHITHSEKYMTAAKAGGWKWPMVSREKKCEEFTWIKESFN